jgi:hypothetical protein
LSTKRKPRWGTNKRLLELYKELNKGFFENKLSHHIRVEWDTDKMPISSTTIARCLWHVPKGSKPSQHKAYLLQISRKLKPRFLQKQVGMSMLHEMVHLKLGVDIYCEDWGGEFDKEMYRLAKAWAFQPFW